MKLPFVNFEPIFPNLLPPNISDLPRTAKRLMQLLSQGTSILPLEVEKSWSLEFLLSPKSFNSSKAASQSLCSITFVQNQFQKPNMFNASARVAPTDEKRVIPASLAFRSIGYKSEALPGIEDLGLYFDAGRGIISNDYHGRAIAPVASSLDEPSAIPGMYCSGWVKRGPTGVIANTMEDAFATAAAITSDWQSKKPFLSGGQGWDYLKHDASERGVKTVSWNDWRKIDAAERTRGKLKGKEREKFTSIKDMLRVLD